MRYKKSVFSIVVIILILISSLYFFITTPPTLKCKRGSIKVFKKDLKVEGPVKILFLRGHGYQRGYEHGVLLKRDIKRIVYLLKSIVGTSGYLVATYKVRKLDRNIPEEYRCEIRGVADGSGVSYYDILLINTFDDLKHLLMCSSLLVVKGKLSRKYFFARNLDYPHRELAGENVIFIYKNRDRNSFLSFAFPGYIGVLTGYNSKGISLSIHTSNTSETKWGRPTGIILRECMEKANCISDVIKIISGEKRCQSNNILVGSYLENSGCVIEYTPYKFGVRFLSSSKGFLACTNHFNIKNLKKLNKGNLKRSYMRYNYIVKNMVPPVNLEKIISIFTHYDGNKIFWNTVSNAGTVQSVITSPDDDLLLVGKNKTPPVNRDGYLKLRLSNFLEVRDK